jgi:hypothetical protein
MNSFLFVARREAPIKTDKYSVKDDVESLGSVDGKNAE